MADAQQVALGVFFVFALAGLAIVGIPLITAGPVAGNAVLSTATSVPTAPQSANIPPTMPLADIQRYIATNYFTGAGKPFSIFIESKDGHTIDFLIRNSGCLEVERIDKFGKKYMSCTPNGCTGSCFYYATDRACRCAHRAIV